MANVMVGHDLGNRALYKEAKWQEVEQDKMWKALHHIMDIKRDLVIRTKDYLTRHLAGIAADNLKGQCTKGHSCKDASKNALKKLIAGYNTSSIMITTAAPVVQNVTS